MNVMTRTRGFALTAAISDFVALRLGGAFERLRARVRRVIVHLSDVNGPRGGRDKRCQLEVRLDGMPQVVVRETGSDLYAAIGSATERAVHAVSRRVARHREHRVRGGRASP